MSQQYPKILDNAILVADSHYNPLGRLEFLEFLEEIKRHKPPQLFLLGDISDLLFGYFKYTVEQNRTLISLINEIARSGVEVWYFEGNHDFFLSGIFDEKVKIVVKKDQPKIFEHNGKKVAMLHGDYRVELRYCLYASVIRNRVGIRIVNYLSLNFLNNWLIRKLENGLISKRLSYNIENFEAKTRARFKDFASRADFLLEGHFHQNRSFDIDGTTYINLPSFACDKSFVRVQSADNAIFCVEQKLK